MSPNPHALQASYATRYSYDEVRRAVNVLVGWDVADRENAEVLVNEWITEDVPDLEDRAHDVVNAMRS